MKQRTTPPALTKKVRIEYEVTAGEGDAVEEGDAAEEGVATGSAKN